MQVKKLQKKIKDMNKNDFVGQKGHMGLRTMTKIAKITAFSIKLIYFTLCLLNLSKKER